MMLYVLLGFMVIIVGVRILMKLKSVKCTSTNRMEGLTTIVTGANTGIGYETAKDFAKRGARVILACRDMEKATQARETIIETTGNNNIICMKLDLASFSSIREFCENVKKEEQKLHVLVNNAGIMGLSKTRRLTEDNLEMQMQVNYFGPFLLTNLLLDLLIKSSPYPTRIVNVSSVAHMWGKIEFDNLQSEKYPEKYSPSAVYGNSKLANILFTIELAHKLEMTGVTVNALHPGYVRTEIYRNIFWHSLVDWLAYWCILTAEEGAQTSIYLSVSDDVKNISGEYFEDCRPVKLMRTKSSKDGSLAKKLWEVSEELTGLSSKLPSKLARPRRGTSPRVHSLCPLPRGNSRKCLFNL